ncbi:MAG: [Fe-Fe] hydrogenase large subunit C-terminal domain-containing protein [Planctomycetota bacterium]
MEGAENITLVSTISEHCRVCYTCVRECPAKAIRISDGQAQVIPERCIGCGNCVRVCSQRAKEVLDTTGDVRGLLEGDDKVAACLAPSFPAEFADCDWRKLVSAVRALGFDYVCEVGFGADLVARQYRQLLSDEPEGRYVATSCPAIVAYVERYYPELVEKLAPIVSPMVATARVMRELHGEDLKVVFIGPCIAKKGEAASRNVPDEVNAAVTFVELRKMFEDAGVDPDDATEGDFDPPHAGPGALFPISRGLLQAAEIAEDLIDGQVVATDGRTNFVEAIREFGNGHLDARLLEVLCCNGCIMGAGMTTKAPLFSRRSRVSRYVRERLAETSRREYEKWLRKAEGVNLRRRYTPRDQRIAVPSEDEIRGIMARMGKHTDEDELNCGACGYDTCREHAVAIYKGLAENEMCLPHTIDQLREAVDELAEAQEQLMQSEKLASMGQLAAGIAHEVNNPLGVVLMYSHLLLDEHAGDPNLKEDLAMITDQADRCKKIVSGLLHFARQNKVVLEMTDAAELVTEAMKSVKLPEGVELVVENELEDPRAELDKDQMIQVLTNLMTNAVDAMGNSGTLTVRATGDTETVRFIVIDTGTGIPQDNLRRIFDPFFTTKQMGRGTGLGLAVTYGVVKMHQGNISVESNTDPQQGATGTTFTITLPRRGKQE